MTIPDEALRAAQEATEGGFGITDDYMRAALTAALPFLTGVKVKSLEWDTDGRTLHMDNTMIMGHGYNWEGYECLRQEANGLGCGYIIWPESISSKLWSLYGTYDGLFIRSLEGKTAAKAAAQADYEARILSAIEPVPSPRAQALEEGDLNARLKAKGMYSIDEMMGTLPVDKWRVQSGMTDLKFFGEWLERKTREYLTMKAAYDAGDKDESDELYEWVLAHYGAFHDVLVNFRAALSSQPVADGGSRKFKIGDRLTKNKGSSWTGRVVGFYSTELTPIGYAIESETEKGSVQIYPEAALRPLPASPGASE